MRLFFIALLACATYASPVIAQDKKGHIKSPYVSAKYLKEICKMTGGVEAVQGGAAACQSYIAGVIDYHKMLQSMGTRPNVKVCVPQGVTLKQLQDITHNYLTRNPHHNDFTAAPAVTLALFGRFPCK